MKKRMNWRFILALIGGPAAGAFGTFLASDAPAVYRALCTNAGLF